MSHQTATLDDGSLPDIRTLCAPRQPGLTAALCSAYAEAAEVCLARHHTPPETPFEVTRSSVRVTRILRWLAPTATAFAAFNNRDDATRDGAYILAIGAVEKEMGLVALMRAETRTGADYYIGVPGAQDIENAHRLEVSGVDAGGPQELLRRLAAKVDQARAGVSDLPAFASVVGFKQATILIQEVLVPDDR